MLDISVPQNHDVPASIAVTASEFAVRPTAVLVHDPSPFGALDVLSRASDAKELKEQFLFRDWPAAKAFAEQHARLS